MSKVVYNITNIVLLVVLLSCSNANKYYVVKSVIEGDTIRLSNGKIVRLLGVDSPESRVGKKLNDDVKRTGFSAAVLQSMGTNALEFTKRYLTGRTVRLEFDSVKRNKKGKLLAYVFFEDGTFINKKVIEYGFGFFVADFPYMKYQDILQQAHRDAKEGKKGLYTLGDIKEW